MGAFSKFYLEFLKNLIKSILGIFKSIFNIVGDIFGDIKNNFNLFFAFSEDFGFLGWIFAIIVLGINFLFFAFVLIKLYQYIRKYFVFRRKELEKDELLEEIAMLNDQTQKLVEEKNNIMNLKMAALSGQMGELATSPLSPTGPKSRSQAKQNKAGNRFTKLINVDAAYENQNVRIYMENDDLISLEELTKGTDEYKAAL